MEEQFKYRKHIKYVRNFTAILLALMIITVWLISFLAGLPTAGIFALVIFSMIFLIELLFIWIFLSRFIKVRIILTDDSIIYKNHKGSSIIGYPDITKIGFSAIKYTGGWIKIESPQKKIRLTVAVKNIQRLVMLLKKHLDDQGLSHLYNDKKLFSFLKTGAFSDESWQRVYQYWLKLLIITVSITLVSVLISLISGFSFARGFFLCFLTYLLPIILYLITEFIFGRRIAKVSDFETFYVPERDEEYERSIFRKAINWGFAVYVLLLLLAFMLKMPVN